MGRLLDETEVIIAIDRHICEGNRLDEDISVILEELQTANPRPTILYAVEDCINGNIIFNARGGCYKNEEDVLNKIEKLTKQTGGTYRIVKYVLSFD